MAYWSPSDQAPAPPLPIKNGMGRLLAAALLTGAVAAGASPVAPERDDEIVAGANPVVPERDHEVKVCAGAAVTPFERRLPEQVRRFAFEGAMLEPFLRLWQSGGRPELPLSPESVIVYAPPNRPYIVGYERQGCLIAFLAIPHQELWHWLRRSVGWLAKRAGPPGTRGRA